MTKTRDAQGERLATTIPPLIWLEIVLSRYFYSSSPNLKGLCLIGLAVPVSISKGSPFAGIFRSSMSTQKTSDISSSICKASFLCTDVRSTGRRFGLVYKAKRSFQARTESVAGSPEGTRPCSRKNWSSSAPLRTYSSALEGSCAEPMSPALLAVGIAAMLAASGIERTNLSSYIFRSNTANGLLTPGLSASQTAPQFAFWQM